MCLMMKVVKQISFTIRVKYIESINKYLVWLPNKKFAMSSEAKAFKNEVKNQLARLNPSFNLSKDSWVKIESVFVFKTSFEKRDCNNCIKIFIDAVSEFFGFNDSRIFDERYLKFFTQGNSYEYIKCTLSEVSADKKEFLIKNNS